MLNRLTLLCSKIYYKEENYLKVKTAIFKYITPPHNNGFGILVYWYITILYSHIPIFLYFKFYYITQLPLFYSFTGFISPAFYILILTQYKSPFSTYTILFIRSIIPTSFSPSLSLKSSFISKLLIKSVLYPKLI